MSQAAELFVCCEPSDRALRDELCTMLAPLVEAGLAREIPSDQLDGAWPMRMGSADVIVALISPEALAESSRMRSAITDALSMEQQRRAVLVPIRARECTVDSGPLADRVIFPRDACALESAAFRKYAFREAVSGVLTGITLCHVTIGDLLLQSERETAAAGAFRHALSIAERLSSEFPNDIEHLALLALVRDRVGEAYLAMGDGPGALAAFQSAKDAHEHLVRLDVDSPSRRQALARCFESIGDVLRAMGEKPLALEAFETCLSLRTKLVSEIGDVISRREVASTYVRIGHVRRAMGDKMQALSAFREGMVLAEQLADEASSSTSNALVTQADAAVFQAERALFCFRTASVLAEGAKSDQEEARELLLRALGIYHDLEQRSVLPESQKIWPPAVEAMLDTLDT